MKYFPNLYLMHNVGGRSSWQHLQATYHMGLIVPYTTEVVSQIASKMTNFRCPLSKYNELDPAIWGETCIAYRVCQNLPLLHSSGGRCFWHHLYTTCGSLSLTIPFPPKADPQISLKIPDFGYTLSVRQMGCSSIRRDIHCFWSGSNHSIA